MSLFTRILDSSMYSPHGICLLWEPELIWLHVVSDSLIAVAYFSIPVCILYIWWKRTDFKYRWIAWPFFAFIVSCGLTHVLAIVTLWTPIYGIEGLVKAATAAASLFTAVVLWRMLPDMLLMPTLAQMQTARQALKSQTQQIRNAEQALQRFRDIEATEPQIRQAQKMEAVGQLTGGIAHDFNNLLTVITGSVEELAHSLKDRPHLAGIVEMIDQAASRGAALTAQLLAFARMQPLSPSAVDVNDLILRAVRMLRRTLGETVEIEVVLADGLPTALVDESQLETAMLNLALNARDAMAGAGLITIETATARMVEAQPDRYPDLAPGWYVVIALLDNGRGIAAEDLGKVVEPFFTTKEVGKGTGLGLSMVYGFAKQSNGHLVIESTPGKGTKVSLFLPAAAPPPQALAARVHAEARVVVVEDDPLLRAAIATRFDHLGHRALTAAGAAEALTLLARPDRVDALFVGAVCGAFSGRQLADEAVKLKPGLRVLLASPGHHGGAEAGCCGTGAVLPIATPYRAADLAATLRAALAQ
uniref:histidine kinase n=1 Tax=Rhodopseudomonas palustris (strain BisA53) TaxID=316055 RepID=Q07RK2_RHOP5